MKNALKQFGKALCYLFLYLWFQVVVTVVAMIGYYFMLGVQMARNGEELDTNALMEDSDRMVAAITPWVVIGAMFLTLLVLWLFFLIRRKKFLPETEVRLFPLKYLPGVVCAAVGLYLLIGYGLPFLPLSEETWESYAEASAGLDGVSVTLFLSNVIAAPVVEEVIFRGLMFGRMKKDMPVWLAALISSAIFALMHGQLLWMSYTFLLGMVCCLAVYRTNSILSSLFIHMFFNLFGSILSFLADGIPDNLYAVMALAGAAALILGVILLWPRREKNETQPVTG